MNLIRVLLGIIICIKTFQGVIPQPVPAGKEYFSLGVVIDSVRVRSVPDEHYALYLPSLYNDSISIPLLCFFEPLARGSLPVERYKELAERHGLILACSNNSHNGAFAEMKTYADHLLKDIHTRFNVNTARIFFSGFSGGARLAFKLAEQHRTIKAVIGCGAGFPAHFTASYGIPFIYSGIIGNADPNYVEMKSNKQILDSLGIEHQLVFFEGGHEWPPAEAFDEALWIILFELGIKDSTQLNEYATMLLKNIHKAIADKDYINALSKTSLPSEWFRNTMLEKKLDSMRRQIIIRPEYQSQIREARRAEHLEMITREDIRAGFQGIENTRFLIKDTIHTELWWKSLNKQIQKYVRKKNTEIRKMGHRLDELVVINAWEEGERYMQEKDYRQAVMIYKVLQVFRPQSGYAWFQISQAYKGMNQEEKATASLKKARELGFKGDF
jgi:predicted esterase